MSLSNNSPKLTPKNVPKRFYVEDGALTKILTSAIPAVFRAGLGAFVQGYKLELQPSDSSKYTIVEALGQRLVEYSSYSSSKVPANPLKLYEFESCRNCKKVREALCILDIDVEVYPCPIGGPTYRTELKSEYGVSSYPFLIDPNTDESLSNSDDIVEYLFETYGGNQQIPYFLRRGSWLTTLSTTLASLSRSNRGRTFDPTSTFSISKKPLVPLVLWGYEASPFSKIVRERLSELEIPYLLRTCSRGSRKRQMMFERTGGYFQAPFLEDPNNDSSLFESGDILRYLDKMYSLQPQL